MNKVKSVGVKVWFKYIGLNIFLAMLISMVLLFLCLKGLDFLTLHGQEIKVPNTVGMPLAIATKTLEDQNFRIIQDSVYKGINQGGLVVDQSPSGGEMVKDHRTIYITISKYLSPLVKLPRFQDIPLKEFESILKSMSISIDSIEYQPDVAKDLVLGVRFLGKNLIEGNSIPQGTKVNLILGDGSGGNAVDLPSLIGLSLDEARFSIRGSQLLLGQVSFLGPITDTAMAKVILQSPATKKDSLVKVSQGSIINIVLRQD